MDRERACNLASACLLLTGAALEDRFGRRRMLGGAVLTATFIAWQLCGRHPMIPPALSAR